MSRESVAVVRKFFDAFNRRDIDSVIAACDHASDVVTVTSAELEARGYRGHEGIRDYFESVTEVWQELSLHPDEVRDLGDRVLVLGRWRSRGRESGAELETPVAWIFQVRGTRIVSSRAYRSQAAALEAAGLDA